MRDKLMIFVLAQDVVNTNMCDDCTPNISIIIMGILAC